MEDTHIYDTSIFIITPDGTYIESGEYDADDDGEGMFVCATNDALNSEFGEDNSICIYKDWFREAYNATRYIPDDSWRMLQNKYVTCVWQPRDKQFCIIEDDRYRCADAEGPRRERIKRVSGFLGGAATCREIMSYDTRSLYGVNPEMAFPAVMLAYHTCVMFTGREVHGYLPAVGQFLYLNQNLEKIEK